MSTTTQAIECIPQDSSLILAAEARRRLRVSHSAWRQLLRAGLRVLRLGKNHYVYCHELIATIEKVQDEES